MRKYHNNDVVILMRAAGIVHTEMCKYKIKGSLIDEQHDNHTFTDCFRSDDSRCRKLVTQTHDYFFNRSPTSQLAILVEF